MKDLGFWLSVAVTYLAIFVAFAILIIGAFKVERERKARAKCMMNHPAGSRARIVPLPTGQTLAISRREYREGMLCEWTEFVPPIPFGKSD